MGVDFGLSETAMIGMAMSAAAMAANTAAQMKRKSEIEKITQRTRAQTEQQRQLAESQLNKTIAESTPEERDKMIAEGAQDRLAQYKTLEDVPLPTMPIMKLTSNSPTIVRTEAAKQLGSELSKAKAEMLARSKLAGFDQASFDRAIQLSRSGENIGQRADFIAGLQRAQNLDIQKWQGAQPDIPVADIMSGVGGLMMSVPSGGAPAAAGTGTSWTKGLPPDWYKAYVKDGQIYSPF